MNRSILIVICDFLLVSLLAFSTVDINRLADEPAAPNLKMDIATNRVDAREDLAAVMKLALDNERKDRDLLMGELTKTRENLSRQEQLLTEREKELLAQRQQMQRREEQAQQLAQDLTRLQAQALNLEAQSQKLEVEKSILQRQAHIMEEQSTRLTREKSALQQQYSTAQTNLQALSRQLESNTAEMQNARQMLEARQADLQTKEDQAAALKEQAAMFREQIAKLANSNQLVLNEKQRLAAQLQVAETEKLLASQQVARMEDEVKVVRQEKTQLAQHADKLADGVQTLAAKSGELAQEIRENRPSAPNSIFNSLATNRVHASFFANRSSFLGIGANRERDTETVLVTDGTNTFAVCHVDETPLVFSIPGVQWEALTGSLSRNRALFSIASLGFYLLDPRVVLIPVPSGQAQALGCVAYRISTEPFKFQDAVVVGAAEGYYGECKFQIDLSTPQYLKMDHNFIKGLFGKFNPKRGDLVFSKTGELLGIMANSTYCIRLHGFNAVAAVKFGSDVRSQRVGDVLESMYSMVIALPMKLQ